MADLTLKEKKKLVAKGKKLDPIKIKYAAELAVGKDFRKELAKQFDCSTVLITNAFSGKAPALLFRINQYIKALN